jgi:hypothetical protein
MHKVGGIITKGEICPVCLSVKSNWMICFGNSKRPHLNVHSKEANA